MVSTIHLPDIFQVPNKMHQPCLLPGHGGGLPDVRCLLVQSSSAVAVHGADITHRVTGRHRPGEEGGRGLNQTKEEGGRGLNQTKEEGGRGLNQTKEEGGRGLNQAKEEGGRGLNQTKEGGGRGLNQTKVGAV